MRPFHLWSVRFQLKQEPCSTHQRSAYLPRNHFCCIVQEPTGVEWELSISKGQNQQLSQDALVVRVTLTHTCQLYSLIQRNDQSLQEQLEQGVPPFALGFTSTSCCFYLRRPSRLSRCRFQSYLASIVCPNPYY